MEVAEPLRRCVAEPATRATAPRSRPPTGACAAGRAALHGSQSGAGIARRRSEGRRSRASGSCVSCARTRRATATTTTPRSRCGCATIPRRPRSPSTRRAATPRGCRRGRREDLGYRRRPDRAQPRGVEHLAVAADPAGGARLVARIDDAALPPGALPARAGHGPRRERRRRRGSRRRAAVAAADPVADRVGVVKTRIVRRRHREARGGPRARRTVRRRVTELRRESRVRWAGRSRSRGGSPTATASRSPASRSRCSGRAGGEELLAVLTTDAQGAFSYRAAGSASRTLRFVHPGTPTVLPAESRVTLVVPAAGSFKPSRKRVLNGGRVVFRGRVASLPLPAAGRWSSSRSSSRPASGPPSARCAPTPRGAGRCATGSAASAATRTYRLRARIPAEAGYPFAEGKLAQPQGHRARRLRTLPMSPRVDRPVASRPRRELAIRPRFDCMTPNRKRAHVHSSPRPTDLRQRGRHACAVHRARRQLLRRQQDQRQPDPRTPRSPARSSSATRSAARASRSRASAPCPGRATPAGSAASARSELLLSDARRQRLPPPTSASRRRPARRRTYTGAVEHCQADA